MATQCTQESVLQFLIERGGKVKNVELIDRFKSVFPSDPAQRALAKETFKAYVDNVAFVRAESGAKYVCLRKKFATSVRRTVERTDGQLNGNDDSRSAEVQPPDAVSRATDTEIPPAPGDTMRTAPVLSINSPTSAPGALTAESAAPGEAGLMKSLSEVRRNTEVARAGEGLQESINLTPDIGITGGDSAALSEDADKTVINLKAPMRLQELPHPASPQGRAFSNLPASLSEEDTFKGKIFCMAEPPGDVLSSTTDAEGGDELCKSVPGTRSVSKFRASRVSQRSLVSREASEDAVDEGNPDYTNISDDSTPKSSRRNFIELMMNSSPQVRRSMVQRNPGQLPVRHRDTYSMRSDSDSSSLVSSIDEDSGTSMLDPLEHEWMMCASDGQWDSLSRLLACEPSLVVKKDFVTGFTCLHWAAKQGKQELLALLVNFAKQRGIPLNINARSSAGYTPLHLAAMHNHVEVVKLLVGAYDADVEVRDYSGRKAAHYLTSCVSSDVRDIIGAGTDSDCESSESGAGRWRFSKVLHTNFRLLNHPEEDACDASGSVKPKPLYRKSSVSKIKPKLQKIRFKTQIIHSTSFREAEEGDNDPSSPPKLRPKSNLFG